MHLVHDAVIGTIDAKGCIVAIDGVVASCSCRCCNQYFYVSISGVIANSFFFHLVRDAIISSIYAKVGIVAIDGVVAYCLCRCYNRYFWDCWCCFN